MNDSNNIKEEINITEQTPNKNFLKQIVETNLSEEQRQKLGNLKKDEKKPNEIQEEINKLEEKQKQTEQELNN
ncbi:4584_t:CDS:2 [Entrophospora sp. SA101]|nr:10404_t:CDS:2 [Entrophospora sp. SA101]CAJ0747171.1 4584_t:CDS:2 [Entrophospora sp. SA101]CAJ0825386.1 7657_t:CDS:2 [Entrophospora sp. SA101]CAJ0872643.1 5019_t:CDS:2 [Entrophospora sp. SA101]